MKTILTFLLTIIIQSMLWGQECNGYKQTQLTSYFLKAISDKNIEKIDMYLSAGIDVNGTFCYNIYNTYIKLKKEYPGYYKKNDSYELLWDFEATFLVAAIKTNDIKIVDYLINKGADVNKATFIPVNAKIGKSYDWNWGLVGKEEFYPLNECLSEYTMRGDVDIRIIKLLIEKGAKLEPAAEDALKLCNIEILQLFIDHGFKFNFKADDLSNAIENNNQKTFDLYIAGGAIADNDCFIRAVRKGDIEKLKLFLKQEPLLVNSVNTKNYSKLYQLPPLGWAVYEGNLTVTKFLVENGANLNSRCIWKDGQYGENFTHSLVEFSDAKHRGGRTNVDVTEYLLLAPSLPKNK